MKSKANQKENECAERNANANKDAKDTSKNHLYLLLAEFVAHARKFTSFLHALSIIHLAKLIFAVDVSSEP